MTVTISNVHGFLDDCNKLTGLSLGDWTETDTGNLLASAVSYDDYFLLTRSAGAAEAYLSYPNEGGAYNLSLESSTFTVIYYRYKTSNSNIKAKIVLVFTGAEGTQTVLDEISSTAWKTGFTYITAGKTIDHIRLYANAAAGTVMYDFVLICKGIFTFPNYAHGLKFDPSARELFLEIPSRITDINQNLGSPSAIVQIGCDLDVGTWKRAGDYVDAEVFYDIAHNSYKEPFQWLDTGTEQFKVKLVSTPFNRDASGKETSRILDLTFREYRRSSGSNDSENYVSRFGLNL